MDTNAFKHLQESNKKEAQDFYECSNFKGIEKLENQDAIDLIAAF